MFISPQSRRERKADIFGGSAESEKANQLCVLGDSIEAGDEIIKTTINQVLWSPVVIPANVSRALTVTKKNVISVIYITFSATCDTGTCT
jgi:hypothetical protein